MLNAILVIILTQMLCLYQLKGQTIAAGYKHSLFIKSDGSLWGMGDNEFGQIGLTDSTNNLEPVKISDSGVMEVYTNYWESFYLKGDGSLWASGWEWSKDPMKVVDSGVSKVSIGSGSLHYIKNDGTLWAKSSKDSVDELVASDVSFVATAAYYPWFYYYAVIIGNDGSLSEIKIDWNYSD
jgi:alpha-tubulin suppressor-like RCC1 family protein